MKATAVPSLQGESLVPSSESLYQEPEALRQRVLLERQRPQALFAHVFLAVCFFVWGEQGMLR